MISIIIQARLGSSRLPGKILKKIGDKSALEYLIDRLKKSRLAEQIIVATTNKKIDQKIVDVVKKLKINSFIGDELDVLNRYYECAKKYKSSIIVRVTSDCPFSDPDLIDDMINFYIKNNYDYISNTTPLTESHWPDGSDVEIFSYKALVRANNESTDKKEREHVTFYFWKNPNSNFKTYNYKFINENLSKYRFTLDYQEDLIVVNKINDYLKEKGIFGNIDDISKFLKENPEISKINSKYFSGIGWK